MLRRQRQDDEAAEKDREMMSERRQREKDEQLRSMRGDRYEEDDNEGPIRRGQAPPGRDGKDDLRGGRGTLAE